MEEGGGAWRGRCMKGAVHGGGGAWRGRCMEGAVHGGGGAWRGTVHGGGGAWEGWNGARRGGGRGGEHKSWSIESIVDHFTVQSAAVSRFQFNIKHYREKAGGRRPKCVVYTDQFLSAFV